MKKICPIMSVDTDNDLVGCREEECALWVPELGCCCHRVDTTRLLAELQKLKDRVGGVDIPEALMAMAEIAEDAELREVTVEHLVDPNEKGEHRHIIAGDGMYRLGERLLVIRMKPLAGEKKD